jgi:hypothetical protein
VAPADGLDAGVGLGLGDGVGGGVGGDDRVAVWVGVDAAVRGAEDVAGGVTVSGVQAAAAITPLTAQNRRTRRFIVSPV